MKLENITSYILQGISLKNGFFKPKLWNFTTRIHYENIVNYLEHLKCSHRSIICSKCIVLQVPFCEERSDQLVRVASFRSDFLQNPYFSKKQSDEKLYFQITLFQVSAIFKQNQCQCDWNEIMQISLNLWKCHHFWF